jgi:hypothetical protein
MKITRIVVVLALCAGAATAQPWIPFECKVRYEDRWNEFAQAMRKAQQGSQIYAPKPFPRTDTEVVEDFKYGYKQMLKGMTPDEISREEWPLSSALERNTLSFRIIKVENWAPDRCRPDRQRDFLYALYITDTATGDEVARAFLNQNGLLGAKPWENREIVRHLLHGCPACQKLCREAFRPEIDPSAYETIFARLVAAIRSPHV